MRCVCARPLHHVVRPSCAQVDRSCLTRSRQHTGLPEQRDGEIPPSRRAPSARAVNERTAYRVSQNFSQGSRRAQMMTMLRRLLLPAVRLDTICIQMQT